MRPLFDSHLDLAWSACSFNRDLTLPLETLRERERHMTDEPARGRATISLPELHEARLAACVATLLARSGRAQPKQGAYTRTDLEYGSASLAYAAAHGQLAYYRLLESEGHLRILRTREDLDRHWKAWEPGRPIGILLSFEGCDPIIEPRQVEAWWNDGLRAAGPSHYGEGRYAGGTHTTTGLTPEGIDLLKEFERFSIALDVTHLNDTSMAEALDRFDGPVLASHHNCRALVPGDRQLTDAQLKRLVERGAVIGAACDAWMLHPGWRKGETSREVVGLEAVADHIDHVCQVAGSARHAAIGSDLDGGFGTEQTPRGLDRFSDLHKLEGILSDRGYAAADIDGIFHGNWVRFFMEALPREGSTR